MPQHSGSDEKNMKGSGSVVFIFLNVNVVNDQKTSDPNTGSTRFLTRRIYIRVKSKIEIKLE